MKRQASVDSLKTQQEFERRLKSGRIAPLYLLEGTETYLRDESLRRLLDAAVDAVLRDFNVAVISVAQGNLNDALELARQFPMISPRRAVVVKGFEAISDERQLELLKDYLRKPVETTALIFVSDGLDNRRNIATMLRKTCEIVNFTALDDREGAPRWVADYIKRAGCFIEMADAAYLVGMVGTDLRRLAAEADKLTTYLGGKGRISKSEIDELVRYAREHQNWELADAVLEGNRKRALELLEHIFANPAEPVQALSLMILGSLARSYRNLLAAKELMAQGAPNSEVAKAVGMSPYAVTHLNEKARRRETEQILKGIARIAATDVALKTSLATPRLQIEMLVCELCPQRAAQRIR